MHPRRFSTLLIGMWLAGAAFMAWMSFHNPRVDDLMKQGNAKAQHEYQNADRARARTLLAHQAAELNRYYTSNWELVQLALGVVLAVNLLFATNGNKLVMTLCMAAIAITAIQYITFTPQIIEIGRGVDFALTDEMFDERKTLRGFQSYYLWLEGAKLMTLTGLTIRLLFGHSTASGRRRRRKPADTVDDLSQAQVNG